jgi:hypothetical protein
VKPDREPDSRRATPARGTELAAFARESENKLRGAGAEPASTTPPPFASPPTVPSELRPVALPRDPPPESPLVRSLGEHAHRMGLVRALLRVGGVSRVEGARALRAELHDVEVDAATASDESLASMVRAVRLVVEEIGGFARAADAELLVWVGPGDLIRDNIAIAAETQGISARVASSAAQFWQMSVERAPDLVVVHADSCGFAVGELCKLVRESVRPGVPIVLLSGASADERDALENDLVERCLPVDVGVDALSAELAALLPG